MSRNFGMLIEWMDGVGKLFLSLMIPRSTRMPLGENFAFKTFYQVCMGGWVHMKRVMAAHTTRNYALFVLERCDFLTFPPSYTFHMAWHQLKGENKKTRSEETMTRWWRGGKALENFDMFVEKHQHQQSKWKWDFVSNVCKCEIRRAFLTFLICPLISLGIFHDNW